MSLFSTTEKVSKLGVKTMGKSWENDMITSFEILSYASNMLPYTSIAMILFMLPSHIIMLILQHFLS